MQHSRCSTAESESAQHTRQTSGVWAVRLALLNLIAAEHLMTGAKGGAGRVAGQVMMDAALREVLVLTLKGCVCSPLQQRWQVRVLDAFTKLLSGSSFSSGCCSTQASEDLDEDLHDVAVADAGLLHEAVVVKDAAAEEQAHLGRW